MVVLLAAVDGGARSPFARLLVVPLVFSTLAYPVRVTVLVGGTIIAGQVGIVLSTAEVRLDVEVARSLRSGQPLALLHADLDHFTGINDGHGHPVGDEVLASVGRLLRDDARPTDVVGRVGGEEFALLLPGSTLDEARTVAERLREAVPHPDHPVRVTMSIGVSALREVADTQEHLVATADQALYVAKRSGRDRVVTAAGIASRPPSTASRPAAVTRPV